MLWPRNSSPMPSMLGIHNHKFLHLKGILLETCASIVHCPVLSTAFLQTQPRVPFLKNILDGYPCGGRFWTAHWTTSPSLCPLWSYTSADCSADPHFSKNLLYMVHQTYENFICYLQKKQNICMSSSSKCNLFYWVKVNHLWPKRYNFF